jgi:hypothetical protein
MSVIKRISGALKSRSKAAYLGMFVMLIGPITRFFDQLFSKKKQALETVPPCMIILGQSRSGSTIIYQVLARAITSSYISNTHLLLPYSASTIIRSKRKQFVSKLNFKNYYGYTATLYDVAEGNEIFEQLYQGNPDRDTLRKRFLTLCNTMGVSAERPLICKNVRYYKQLPMLLEAVPEIKVLRVERSLEMVGQSALNAYHELGYFNPIPDSIRDYPLTNPSVYAGIQVSAMNAAMDEAIEGHLQECVLRIRYEDFCDASEAYISEIHQWLSPSASINKEVFQFKLKASTRVKVDEDTINAIRNGIKEYHEGA